MKVSAKLSNSKLRKVDKIINHEDRTWKENLIRDIFMDHDAEEILKIRLPRNDEEDFIAWTAEKHGMFSVKSAYNLALDLKLYNPPNSSGNNSGDRELWNTIWKANVSPKVKIFTWKLATNSLAVQVNRSKRIPNMLPICTICGMEEETLYHATMKCTHAMEIRQGLANSWKLPCENDLWCT
jgi:hypothetical protein